MHPKPAYLLVLAATLSGLLACGSDDASQAHVSRLDEPLDDERRAALRSELEAARSRWRQANVRAYRIDVVRGGSGMVTQHDRIQVEEDSITSAVRVQDGVSRVLIPREFSMYDREDDSIYSMLGTSADSRYSSVVSGLPTVPFLFRLLDNAVDSALLVIVEYDPDLGYPRYLFIDSSTALHDEGSYRVQEFEVMQGR